MCLGFKSYLKSPLAHLKSFFFVIFQYELVSGYPIFTPRNLVSFGYARRGYVAKVLV